ncbi:MAG: hypothetical protein ACQEW9_18915 [Bacteroidota bacterium]|uniref:Uncharacterized protein n=1 Tax=Algoriphagus faecimaris TaxID=686796 RepID=A0A1G6Q388_9BACT|nr:hypothetical protein [Algoriphagus faecimaris]SDC86799.1 hypothetical protein SAMN04488104_100819 [Algoriphagus faecimaris]
MDYNELKRLNGLQTRINLALIHWDPIGIQNFGIFAHNVYLEYVRYIDPIIEVISERSKLEKLLLDLAADITGLDRENRKLRFEVKNLAERLMEIKKEEDAK